MKLVATTFFLFICFAVQAQQTTQLPDLILKQGEVRELPAQRWEFSKLVIPPGATLKVTQGSAAVLHLIIRDSCKIQGRIVAREFSSEEHQEFINVPGKDPVEIEFKNNNKGGTGGYGGQGGGQGGGSGAVGNTNWGGGGGSGGGRFQQAVKPYVIDYKGLNASDQRGANSPGAGCGAMGGNGARRADYANGGIVFLEVYGAFDGTNGSIDVSGSDGAAGRPGARSSFPNSSYGCQSGGGGGGGGAPGGQGGYVIGYFAGDIFAYPNVRTNGGRGGAGGSAPGDQGMTGTAGSEGENGRSGKVMFFKKS